MSTRTTFSAARFRKSSREVSDVKGTWGVSIAPDVRAIRAALPARSPAHPGPQRKDAAPQRLDVRGSIDLPTTAPVASDPAGAYQRELLPIDALVRTLGERGVNHNDAALA